MNNANAVREAFTPLRAEIVGLFRKLWANPELPGFVAEAMRQLADFLERRELESRIHGVKVDAPRLGAWKTMRQDPASFWNATWAE